MLASKYWYSTLDSYTGIGDQDEDSVLQTSQKCVQFFIVRQVQEPKTTNKSEMCIDIHCQTGTVDQDEDRGLLHTSAEGLQ